MVRSTKCSHLGRTRPLMLLDGGVSGPCSDCMPSSFCRELGAERTLGSSQSGDGEWGGRQGHDHQPRPYVPPIRPVGTWLGGHRPEGTVGTQLVSVVAAVFLPPCERGPWLQPRLVASRALPERKVAAAVPSDSSPAQSCVLARACRPGAASGPEGLEGPGDGGPSLWGCLFSERCGRIPCDLPTARSASSLPLTAAGWPGAAAPRARGTCTPFLNALTKSDYLSTGQSPALPLLFPCGTVKGEILPKMLKDRGDDNALAHGHGHPGPPPRVCWEPSWSALGVGAVRSPQGRVGRPSWSRSVWGTVCCAHRSPALLCPLGSS